MFPTSTVTVFRPTVVIDDFEEIVAWAQEAVENVVVEPGTAYDVNREDQAGGDRSLMTLHFPKDYAADLAGCRVLLPEPWSVTGSVVGRPEAYPKEYCPTAWNRKVYLEVSEWQATTTSSGIRAGTTSL